MDRQELRGALLRLMGGNGYRPLNKSEISRDLSLTTHDRPLLREELAALTREGKILEGKKGRFELPKAGKAGGNLLRGTIKFLPRGHAWFYPDLVDPDNQATGIDLKTYSRLHIPRRETGTALEGDRVMVSFHLPRPFAGRRTGGKPAREEEPDARGKVEKVLDRRSGRVVGVFKKKGKFGWVETEDPAMDGQIDLTGETTAAPGQLVVVELEQWEKQNNPRGRVLEVLGWPGDAGVDIVAVIHRQGLRTSFPEDVIAETRAVPEEVDPKEIARREDWRDRLVITIDPADAKDHDDAIWVERNKNGWTVAVHIADVSHYVKPRTSLDKEASERGNSTYLVDRVLPMLPPELSNGICSLKPHVNRLTKCAVIEVSTHGKVLKKHFCDAVINSQSKLSYEQAQEILDGKPAPEGSPDGLEDMVREAWKMASVLRKKRFADGALDLEMPEIRVKLDEKGRAVEVHQVDHTSSHQLIEECMLLANETVAHQLKIRNKPTIYRIHEDPDFGRLADYTETAKSHGYKPGDLSNRAHIQALLDSAKGRPDEHLIKLGLLKSLKRAAYSADPLGHYGLAKGDYCHFTSPIRRYADLIVHRSLQAFLTNPPKQLDKVPGQNDLAEFARHISDTERTSAEAESETKQIKMLEYLDFCTKQDPQPVFEGVITDVRMMGLMVEATDLGARGVIKREDLPRGDWRFEQSQMRWVSRAGLQFQLGQKIQMQVARIDFQAKFVDFRIAGDALPEPVGPVGRSTPREIPSKKFRSEKPPKGKTGRAGFKGKEKGKFEKSPAPPRAKAPAPVAPAKSKPHAPAAPPPAKSKRSDARPQGAASEQQDLPSIQWSTSTRPAGTPSRWTPKEKPAGTRSKWSPQERAPGTPSKWAAANEASAPPPPPKKSPKRRR
jgi:ribonuclease R